MQITHHGRRYAMTGVDGDHIAKLLKKTGTFYEIDLLKYMQSIKGYLPAGETIDVGANIGNHTIFLAEFVRPPVTAYEPSPKVLPLLKDNLSNNGIDATVVELGLGANQGFGQVEIVDQANIGNTRVIPGQGDTPITTLDDECRGKEVALIKVDVEGMEIQVLQGAVETLKRCKPHLFLEAATKAHLKELREFLEPLGYRPVVRWAYTPVWHFVVDPPKDLIRKARWMRLTRWFR
jgi:FkbM family methyltransferase